MRNQTPELPIELYEGTPAEFYIQAHIIGESDGVSCWRHDDVIVREEGAIEGKGLFADRMIEAGTIVAVKLGSVVTEAFVRENAAMINGSHQDMGNGLHLAGVTPEEVGKNLVGYNHSCEANATIHVVQQPPMAFIIAQRDIVAGEEIAVDYSLVMGTNTHNINECACGSPSCRNTILPAEDWQNSEFQTTNEGHFANFMQEKIDAM